MRSSRLRVALAAGAVATLIAAAQPVLAQAVSRHIRLVTHIPYGGGTDISFAGDRVFMTESSLTVGRVRILDVSGAKPKVIGNFACGGDQNDVEAISEDLIAVGNHAGQCLGMPASGLTLVDVSDPATPLPLGFAVLPVGTHTLTKHPTEPLIYASNSINNPTFAVEVSNPRAPIPIPLDASTCHDITFWFKGKEKLGFCAGTDLNRTQIWDMTDPMAPTVIGEIRDEQIGYHHEAMATPDGRYLVIADEDSRGSCSGKQARREYGALSIYDIRNRARPKLVGFMNAPRGPSVCWAHNFNFIDNRTLVIGWWQAGTSVIDISDPAEAKEVAFFQPDVAAVWSSYFYKGHVYINSDSGGWVVEVSGY